MTDKEEPNVTPGPVGTSYMFLKCPVLGRYRCSLLCRTICADNAWADSRAEEVRGDCESWSEYEDIKSKLEEEE